MKTRFDKERNNPHILNLKSKQRVMLEFKSIREGMLNIKQEKIHPGNDPSMPDFLKSHHEQIFASVTHSDVLPIKETPHLTVNGFDEENIPGLASFIKIIPAKKDFNKIFTPKESPRARYQTNLWDASNFSSFDPKLPIYHRSPVFNNFDLQTKRPSMPQHGCHEARFMTLDHFPKPLTYSKHTP